MSADIVVAILFCLILLVVLSSDAMGRLRKNRATLDKIVTASTHPNTNLACLERGIYRFSLDSETQRNLVVYVNGKRQQELKLSTDTSLSIIVA